MSDRLTMEAALLILRDGDEASLRDINMPWPENEEEMTAIIRALAERTHNYGTCVYAMSISAEAAYNYIAKQLGVTGFQAGCADMDILARTRHLKWGRILDFENLLYPQYANKFKAWGALLEENKIELAKRAKKNLEENPGAAPGVVAHWKRLAVAS